MSEHPPFIEHLVDRGLSLCRRVDELSAEQEALEDEIRAHRAHVDAIKPLSDLTCAIAAELEQICAELRDNQATYEAWENSNLKETLQ